MWKWIDDLLGRGFAMTDYLELIALFGVTIIPLSLPLTILLSSVMVYGDMAEHYELSSLKSAGLSLVRIFRPALILAFATAGLSIASSNYFKPMASKAFLRKFNNMRLSKVTFALEEKVFNLDFNDHAIYADKKSKDGKRLEKVMSASLFWRRCIPPRQGFLGVKERGTRRGCARRGVVFSGRECIGEQRRECGDLFFPYLTLRDPKQATIFSCFIFSGV